MLAPAVSLAPMQIVGPVSELISGLVSASRTPSPAWTPATDQTVKVDETLQKGAPGTLMQTLVPSSSSSGNGQTSGGSAAPTATLSSAGFDLPGASFARAEFDSEIPASISQTVPVPPG